MIHKRNQNILSIDPATSSGIAYLKNNKITVFNCNCRDPSNFFTWFKFNGFYEELDAVLLEEFVYFNKIPNPKTTRDLIKRIGYYQHRFEEENIPVHMMHVTKVRKSLGVKGKSSLAKNIINQELRELTGLILSTDITDATAQLMYHIGYNSLNYIKYFEFEKLKTVNT